MIQGTRRPALLRGETGAKTGGARHIPAPARKVVSARGLAPLAFAFPQLGSNLRLPFFFCLGVWGLEMKPTLAVIVTWRLAISTLGGSERTVSGGSRSKAFLRPKPEVAAAPLLV